ncbi:hypothetical protein KM295_06460 [Natronomonas sp. F2-12]|uniref:Uncharacterized protein n=1 Tax=Natronomonas aquatica TaxID=2841590 RepID=A0A9R1D5I9_9EURY|nr:hypothetical protein [Natronomonas aquatica]MCQ4333131.1 hypothetical protein [Natronomonas aquatica]
MEAAIIGLIRSNSSLQEYAYLLRRNKLLHKNLEMSSDYDILLFHDKPIRTSIKDTIKHDCENVRFIYIENEFTIPPWTNPNNWVSDWRIGYKHMCRFMSINLWDYVSDYEYILRLDDDSWIESRVDYDIFKRTSDMGYEYGHPLRRRESHTLTNETLPQFTKDYVEQNGIDINCGMDELNDEIYYNNFFITKTSFWFRDNVQDYLRAIDQSGGIYKYRWGDAPIHTLATKMFMESDKIHEFEDIKYTHSGWSNYDKTSLSELTPEWIFRANLTPNEYIYWILLYPRILKFKHKISGLS